MNDIKLNLSLEKILDRIFLLPSNLFNSLIKKEYYKMKFGPKAKSKKEFQVGKIKEQNSDKVYIFDCRKRKYYWIKNKRILYDLGYAETDVEEIDFNQIKNCSQGNPIYWSTWKK